MLTEPNRVQSSYVCVSLQTYGSYGEAGMASGSRGRHRTHCSWLCYKDMRRGFSDLWASAVCQLFVNQASAKIEMVGTHPISNDIENRFRDNMCTRVLYFVLFFFTILNIKIICWHWRFKMNLYGPLFLFVVRLLFKMFFKLRNNGSFENCW